MRREGGASKAGLFSFDCSVEEDAPRIRTPWRAVRMRTPQENLKSVGFCLIVTVTGNSKQSL